MYDNEKKLFDKINKLTMNHNDFLSMFVKQIWVYSMNVWLIIHFYHDALNISFLYIYIWKV